MVGSKADYKPFGYRDPSGAIVGIEPDMAKDVADESASNRSLSRSFRPTACSFCSRARST